jgi:hypothetical protein
MNISLLWKWWWVLENEEGLWKELVQLKYINGCPTCLIQSQQTDSPMWSDLLKVRPLYLRGRSFKLNNGKMICFWLDPWLKEKPLCVIYPMLYDLCLNPKSSVHDVYQSEWVIPLKIILLPIFRDQWYLLAGKLNEVVLNDEKDKPVLRWIASKKFNVKSMYNELTKHDAGPSYKEIWKSKIYEKVKIFM